MQSRTTHEPKGINNIIAALNSMAVGDEVVYSTSDGPSSVGLSEEIDANGECTEEQIVRNHLEEMDHANTIMRFHRPLGMRSYQHVARRVEPWAKRAIEQAVLEGVPIPIG